MKILTLTRLDDEAKQRFQRECQAMGALSDHPSIVTIHDAGFTEDGRPFLMMAYVPGGSLADRIDADGGVGWPEAFRIGVRLAGGLETAHRAGILHRDLKPANVLISPFGEQLTDFGIARIAGALETRTGQISASPAYAAPEILAGSKPTVQSDIYSLGATLFEIITGEPAFVRHTDESIVPLMLRISQDPLPDLRQRGLPPDAAAALEWAMAKEPTARPSTALAFARVLQKTQQAHEMRPTPVRVAGEPELLAAEPHEAPRATHRVTQPTPPPPGSLKPARRERRRWLVAAGAILGMLAAGLGLAALARSRQATDDPPPAAAVTIPAVSTTGAGTTASPTAPTVAVLSPSTEGTSPPTQPVALTSVVPDLTQIADPVAFLRDAGFEVQRTSAYSDEAPYGQVVRQDPPPGSPVPAGSRVDVVVSLGPEAVLAFDTNRDANTDIYASDASGDGAARLTRSAARDSGAAWSPDGRLIAFASNRSGADEIYVMGADGADPRRLTSTPGSNVSPGWSPDGARLAFASTRDGDLEIYTMLADGTGAVRLTNSDDRDFGPAWSPDGTMIAFGSEREGLVQVFVMNADGTNQRRLTTLPGRNFDPAWSPDGSQIAFVSDRDGNQEIFLMRSDGTGQTNLSESPSSADTSPAWSAAGDVVVFVSDRTGDLEIFAMTPGGEASNLSNNPAADEAAPAWSPAGGPAG